MFLEGQQKSRLQLTALSTWLFKLTDTFCVPPGSPFKVGPNSFDLRLNTGTNPNILVGDSRVLDAARQQIRQGFRENAALSASDPSIQPALKHAEEVAHFLRTNLVQGEKKGDRYGKG